MNPAVVGAVAGQMTPKERTALIVGATVLGVMIIGVGIWKFDSISQGFKSLWGGDRKNKRMEKKLAKIKKKALEMEGWKKNYYQDHNADLTISATEAGKLAGSIYDGIDMIDDDEEYIFAGFRGMRTQADLSYVCWQYYNRYKQDLYTQLQKNLNVEEQIELFTLTNNLPKNK